MTISAARIAKTIGMATMCAWMAACGGKIAPTTLELGGGEPEPDPTPLPPDYGPHHPGDPGYPGDPEPKPPQPDPAPTPVGSLKWQSQSFTYDRAQSSCTGKDRFVRYDAKYAKWVGVVLCTSTRYKIFLGETQYGVFHEIGDYAGNGQDHCELVNADFKIPNEDDVKSGCPSCDLGMAGWESPGAVPVYSRANFGDAFKLESAWPMYNLYTASWYECGVSIP